MSGILSASVKTYLQQASFRAHLSARITWPASVGTLYYTDEDGAAVASATLGPHLPYIRSAESVKRVVSDRDGGLQGVESGLTLFDPTKTLSNAMAGSDGDSMEGSAILIRWALGDTSIAPANWPPHFAGIVEQVNAGPGRTQILKLRANDLFLRRIFPHRRIHLGDWPHAANETSPDSPDAVLDKYVPLYLGKWDSRSAGGGGAIETLNVDDRKGVNNRWLISQGCIKRILAAYEDNGTLLAASTYSLEYATRGGVVYSALKRTNAAGRFTGPVTVDIEGLETAGDGSGTLIENPASQIELLLNIAHGNYDSGAYPTSAPINATYLAATEAWFDQHGIKGSVFVTSPEPLANILDRWAGTWPFIRVFWTFRNSTSEIAIRFRDWTTYDYTSDPLLRWITEDDGTKMVPARIRRDRVDRYVARYLTGVSGSPTRSLSVRDASLGYNASSDRPMPFSLAALG